MKTYKEFVHENILKKMFKMFKTVKNIKIDLQLVANLIKMSPKDQSNALKKLDDKTFNRLKGLPYDDNEIFNKLKKQIDIEKRRRHMHMAKN